MKENFAPALARVLVYEGGKVDNPSDPGGRTNKGITQATYTNWLRRNRRPQADVYQISDGDVGAIYKTDYWDRIEGDDLAPGVDFCMFDAAVNSGVGGATEWAQAVLDLPIDGDFGPKTKTAMLGVDPETFIREFCSRRLGTLQRLKTWSTFGKGWSARIANVQKTALAWAQSGEGPDPVQTDTVGGNAKARPADVPTSRTRVIVAHATTVGGAVATGAAQAGQSLTGLTDTFTWMKYVLGAITILGAIAGMIVFFGKQADVAASAGTLKATVDPDADTGLPTTPVVSAIQPVKV